MAAGFIFVAGALPVGFYFDKKRSIAMGIVGGGSGFGAAAIPQATQYFMSQFGWRNTYLFHAGKAKPLNETPLNHVPAPGQRYISSSFYLMAQRFSTQLSKLPTRCSIIALRLHNWSIRV